jgi:hypothetical protein
LEVLVKKSRVFVALVGGLLAVGALLPAHAAERQSPSVRFFSGGSGARADWFHTEDDSSGDQQVFRIRTTPTGYAGIDVLHAEGLPTATYPNSSFDVRASAAGPSLGTPRLVYVFSDGGNASLRPLTWTTEWQTVSDNNWDNNIGGCGYRFQVTWQEIQACHPGTVVTQIFFVADPGPGVEFQVDKLNTAGEVFGHARDNANRPQA